ncbi:MAG: aspartate kinase [Anaerolineales bacterium]
MTRTLVAKFGGTSVGSVAAIRTVTGLVRAARAEWPQVVVVVSAMNGVTNALLEGANTAATGDDHRYRALANELSTRHDDTIDALLESDAERRAVRARVATHINEFATLCHAVKVLGEASPRALDTISSLGERINMHIVAASLREQGCAAAAVRASDLICTDDHFQAANPDMDATRDLTRARLLPLLQDGTVPVVTGFMGATPDGAITTLGRGGSDYSAAILATALDADELWIWTDVNGVMTTDPRVDGRARTLNSVTYREIAELAYYGAKVLHPKTIRPVLERGITLRIKNTFEAEGPSTRVVPDQNGPNDKGAIRAVTAIKDQSLITVEGLGMIGVQGIAARTFGAVARTRTSVTLISQASSEQSICFTVQADHAPIVVKALEKEFGSEVARGDVDRVWSLDDVVIVTVVGAGMQHTPGIAGRVFSALGAQRLNVIAIAQGSSDCSISLITTAADADDSVRAIHSLIVEDEATEAMEITDSFARG